jgi:hypothetical protein
VSPKNSPKNILVWKAVYHSKRAGVKPNQQACGKKRALGVRISFTRVDDNAALYLVAMPKDTVDRHQLESALGSEQV